MRAAIHLGNFGVPCLCFGERHAALLRRLVPGIELILCADEAEFLAALPDAELAVVWRFQQAWFEAAPRLRRVITPAAGRDYFRIEPPPGVTIHYGSFHGQLMGETVVGMMLAASRGLLTAATTADAWPSQQLAWEMRLLRGSHLCILGFGSIGRVIGRLAKPFGMRVTGITRGSEQRPDWFTDADRILHLPELDAILPEVDHLVLVLPASAETDQIIDHRRLCLLPSSARLYNVGRGNAIDEAALRQALIDGRLAGACLDVFAEEPLPADAPLRDAPNLLITPHASAFAPEYMDAFVHELAAYCRAEATD